MELELLEIPAAKLKQIKAKGIASVEELAMFYPKRYEDRSNIISLNNLHSHIGEKVSIVGAIKSINVVYASDFLAVVISDGTNDVTIKWFHQTYLARQFIKGETLLFFGKIDYSPEYGFGMVAPSSISRDVHGASSPMPIYPKIRGMSSEYLQDCINKAVKFLKQSEVEDFLPQELCDNIGIDTQQTFLNKVHAPNAMQDLDAVIKRKAAEQLVPFCINMMEKKYEIQTTTDKTVEREVAINVFREFEKSIEFELTEDQNNTVLQMIDIVSSRKRLDALVQGDVGCGKTIIAIAMSIIMAAGGFQTVIMAPTGVLAEQHYKELTARLAGNAINVGFINGGMKAKEKKEVLAKIKDGTYQVIVGTHAVISKAVEYKALGLTIVDEEHRFGVAQRAALRKKAMEGTHSISMSATPIPRSLALSIYGEATTVYNIKSMPKGRKPITTVIYSDEIKTYEAVYRQIKLGRQAYIVCPLIDDSEATGMDGVDSVTNTLEQITKCYLKYPEVKVAAISGKMKEKDIQDILHQFKEGIYHVLISTTIVEVGVNIPNATVMVIKNAERFGLAQLHQLRGRVGRGSYQAYCVLMSENKANQRLQVMTTTNDGFEIAKADLEQRGTGSLIGTMQSGFNNVVELMIEFPELYSKIKTEIEPVFAGKARYDRYKAIATRQAEM